jgi:hypothetical protein
MKYNFMSIPRSSTGQLLVRRINFDLLIKMTPWVKDLSRKSITERVYCLEHSISKIPKCIECNNDVKWLRGRGYYAKYCGKSCSVSSEQTQDKLKLSYLSKTGYFHNSQNPEVKNKKKLTCLLRFGFEYPGQNKDVMKNRSVLYFQKTGYCHNLQNPEVLNAKSKSYYEKTGYFHNSQNPEVRHKMSVSLANNFKSRRNEEGTDYSGVVYILHFPQHNAVKIGLTGDFLKRSKDLIKDFGEFSVKDIIETDSCNFLEYSLHQKFSNYRICLEEGCGRTEFFNEEILKL